MERHGLVRFFREEERACKKNAIELDPESFTGSSDNRISEERKAENLYENVQCASRCRFVCRSPSTLDVQLLLQSDTLLSDIRNS